VLPLEGGVWRHELAGSEAPADAFARLRARLQGAEARWVVLEDAAADTHRAARLAAGRLEAVLFLGPDPALPPRAWLASLFARAEIGSAARRTLLAGVASDAPPPSPTLCVCHGVTEATVCQAVRAGARSLAAIGAATAAGTGCGSCRPELAGLLARLPERLPEPA
jgi:assimilatory nitrate reductase catalytic subunit